MNGFYLIDKPLEISSFDVIRKMRKTLDIRKMGHTGTLDPLATGALLIATGNYTKLIPYFEKDSKIYEFDIMLDGMTDSFDLAEPVQYISGPEQDHYRHALTQATINDLLQDSFTGTITQVPPKYSALKIDGKRAYDLARAGEDVDMKTREVEIKSIEILSYAYPKLTLKAQVSAGTYIRSIASDLGDMLGCGGYVSRLRRTQIGELAASMNTLIEGEGSYEPLSIQDIFPNTTTITLSEEILADINNGKLVYGDFDYPVDQDLFVIFRQQVTNIVYYNGEYIKPVRKI